MKWLSNYSLYLFDFDGLLVDTERAHYAAYKKMCSDRGFDLDWSFERYLEEAHYRAEGLQNELRQKFPELFIQEPSWKVLYNEKRAALLDYYDQGKVSLMPGVERLLNALADADIPRCVVTHSDEGQVSLIRRSLPVLNTIPYWVTRHDYTVPKPDPECYRYAIGRYGSGPVIGFEDSPRGLTALMGTAATPVLISTIQYPEIASFKERGAYHYQTLLDLPEDQLS